MPFTDPVTTGPDPRRDLQSEAGLAWLAKVRPNLTNTPAGPAMATIDTLRGSRPGVVSFYSPEQTADQQRVGINLVGSGPFEWDAGNTAQLNAALAARGTAASQAQYLKEKGQAELEGARAATEGKLAMYDPSRMQAMMMLKAAEINPGLWAQPEFKQKIGVPLTSADKVAMLQGEHPGIQIASGLKQLEEGHVPGSSMFSRLFDPRTYDASRFGLPPLTPREKVERALSGMTSDRASEWRRVAEIMGLINPVTGTPSR